MKPLYDVVVIETGFASGVTLCAGGNWVFEDQSGEARIVDMLRQQLDYLDMDEDGLHALVKDATARLLGRSPLYVASDWLTKGFLMSSDVLRHAASAGVLAPVAGAPPCFCTHHRSCHHE